MTQAVPPVADTRAPAGRPGFRPDVEGLRALALGLVLLFHAGVPGAGGGRLGVDVFFVISGFLITGLLVREVEATGRVDLARFYARRARRILPSAVVVTCAALLMTLLLAPSTLGRVGVDAVAATLQVANWRFAFADLAGLDPVGVGSPLLHYWSLAVEEQFYLVWPPVVVLTAAVVRRRGGSVRRALVVVATLLLVVSLAVSVVLTPLASTVAYLVTPTRAWQLAAGALLALCGPQVARATRQPWWPRASAAGGLLGLLLVLTSAYWTGGVDYPGWAAVVPTAGAVALVAAGAGAPGPLQGALSWAPVLAAGRLSYVWYLWHAPVVYAARELGVTSWPALLAVELVAGGGLAWLTAVLVERPLRFSPAVAATSRRGLLLGASATVAGLAVSAAAVGLG